MITFIHGAPATGKTRNAEALRAFYGFSSVIDGFEFRRGKDDQGRMVTLTDGALVLTRESPQAIRKHHPDARVICIGEAKAELARPYTSFQPILSEVPPPGEDGYAFCQHDGHQRVGWHVHDGARIAWAKPEWAKGKLLIHIMGGTAPQPGFEDEGTAFLIDGLTLMEIGFDLASLGEAGK